MFGDISNTIFKCHRLNTSNILLLLDRLKVTITRSLKSINQVRSGEKSHHKFPAVNEIYDRYRANGKITMSIEKVTDSDGVTTNTITFIDKAAYDEWYAEIDVINTDPPTDVTYVETPIEPV